jgi:hypothetical protein
MNFSDVELNLLRRLHKSALSAGDEEKAEFYKKLYGGLGEEPFCQEPQEDKNWYLVDSSGSVVFSSDSFEEANAKFDELVKSGRGWWRLYSHDNLISPYYEGGDADACPEFEGLV